VGGGSYTWPPTRFPSPTKENHVSTESKAKAHLKVQSQKEADELSDRRTAAEQRGDKGAKARLTNKLNDIVAGLDN
jgi:hypothetical protein